MIVFCKEYSSIRKFMRPKLIAAISRRKPEEYKKQGGVLEKND